MQIDNRFDDNSTEELDELDVLILVTRLFECVKNLVRYMVIDDYVKDKHHTLQSAPLILLTSQTCGAEGDSARDEDVICSYHISVH